MIVDTSQYGEASWIHENVKDLPPVGYFCEVGVGPGGISFSNTWLFEQLGWTGLLVEADLRNVSSIVENRPRSTVAACAATERGGTWQSFKRDHDPFLSVLDVSGPTYVWAQTLTHLLWKCPDILSIDTEGTELDVWAGCLWRPKVVIVEHDTLGKESQEALILSTFDGYTVGHRTAGNLIFVRKP